jgi:hypothetical protein
MKKETYKPTNKEKDIIQEIIENFSPEGLDTLRSKLHSASIKKGYAHSKLVSDVIKKTDGVIMIKNEVYIPFINVDLPTEYTQEGYTVDIWVETENKIYLIDPKGVGHNNNTPIHDEVKKWVLAKKEVQSLNSQKNISFILLKPNDIADYEFERLKKSYNEFGLDLFRTDEFLSKFTGINTSVSIILKEQKDFLMREGLREISYL